MSAWGSSFFERSAFSRSFSVLFGVVGILTPILSLSHVNEGNGNALQLFSYRMASSANKPIINGSILSKISSAGIEAPEEWKDAYARNITLNDATTATIFLMNDDDSLYVAMIRPDNNNGDGIGTFLYFDQGIGGVGDHDNQLTGSSGTLRNEAGYGILRQSGTFVKQDQSWTGTQWAQDDDAATDFNGAASILGSGTKVQAFEFAIPLRNNKGFTAGNADLQVTSLQQELGMFIRVSRGGSDCDSCYWDKTNGKAGDAQSGAGWADVRLNVSHSFTTFYSSFARNGNPTVDGSLNDDAWRGSYRRDIYLTNFNGKVIPATLYSVQDPTAKNIYVGFKIRDTVNNASDSLQIYYEEKSGDNTTPRDYLLESGFEDAISAKAASAKDMYWNGSAWVVDGEVADTHAAAGTFTAPNHLFEMRVPYQAGAQDIGVTDVGFPGFLIRYHDADQAVGSQEFFWEYSVNSDAVRVNLQSTSGIYITSGWANFQLGAPYTQVIFPQDSAIVEGTVNLRVYAEGAGGITDIDSVKTFRAADTTLKSRLTRIGNVGEWSGSWDAGRLSNGIDTLVFRTFANNGIFVDRLVILTIGNVNSSVAPPTIALVSPAAGSTLSGTQSIQFNASGGGGTLRKTYIVVDGTDTLATTSATTHNLVTTGLVEGSHTVQLWVYNSNGASAHTAVVNYIVKNKPSVSWNLPAGGSSVSGAMILDYSSTLKGQATVAADSMFVDGQGFASLKATAPDTLNVSSLADGTHTFEIRITDSNGKTAVSAQKVISIRNGPWVTLLTPVAGATVSGKVRFTYHDSTVSSVSIVSDSLLIDGKANRAFSLTEVDTLNSSLLPDGEHTFQVKCMDSRGRVSVSALITLLVRNGPLVLIDSALADSTISGILQIHFRVTPVSPATTTLKQISIDGGGFVAMASDSIDTLDTRRFSDGSHSAQIRGLDDYGKEGFSRLVKFNVHNAPSVGIISPAVDAYVHGGVVIKFMAKAVAPDTLKVTEISAGGGDWIKTTTDSTYELNTKSFKDGELFIQVRTIDGSGKADTTLAFEMVVDNSPPKISFPAVSYGDGSQGRKGVKLIATVQGLDLLSGMNKDSAMVLFSPVLTKDSALVLTDDGKGADAVAGDNVFSSYVMVRVDTNGSIPFSLRARDALGNDSILVSAIVLDNLPPVVSLTVNPLPIGADTLSGDVYVSKVTVKGGFSDANGSGMAAAILIVLNDSGQHIQNSPLNLPISSASFSRIVPLIEGHNFIYLVALDRAGNADTVKSQINYIVPKVTQLIKTNGGALYNPNGASVLIPGGALNRPMEITIRSADPSEETKPLNPLVKLLGIPMDFGPNHTTFNGPVKVTLAYTDADLDPNQDGTPDIRPEDLTIVFWDGSTWVRAGEAKLDGSHHTLTVEVNHFTLFDLAEDKTLLSPAVVAFWNNNPIRQSHSGVFHYKLPEKGNVSLDILDMAGDLVKGLIPKGSTKNAGEWSWEWNGDNVSGRFAGAGLYIYVFRFEPSSGKSVTLIRKPLGLVQK